MGLKGELVKAYAEDHGRRAIARFAIRLLGMDDDSIQFDEEVWRTNEEGRHFKFESTTGEIKGGFGGKFNGMKLGASWRDGGSTVGPPKPPEKPKEPPKTPEPPKGPEGELDDPDELQWLMDVPPGKRPEAYEFVSGVKEAMKDAKRKYEEAREYYYNGADYEAFQNLLRVQGLEDYSEYWSPEEFVMMCGKISDRKKLNDLMAAAQGWPENAKTALDERLSDDNKKILAYLQKEYGYDKKTGIPYDSELNDARLLAWRPDDAQAWMSLESIALGGPGGKIPESVLRKAKLVGVTESGADYSWYTPTRYSNLEKGMAVILGDKPRNNYTLEEFQDINQRFLDMLADDKADSSDLNSSVEYVMPNLRNRMGFSVLTDEMIERLNHDERKRLQEIVEKYDGNEYGKPFSEFVDEDFRKAENVMYYSGRKGKEAQKERAEYCLLMEKMLIGAEPAPEEERKAKKKKEQEEANAKKQQEEALKAERAEKNREETRRRRAAYESGKAERERAIASTASVEDVENAFESSGYFAPDSTVDLARVEFNNAKDTIAAYEKVIGEFPFLFGELHGINTGEIRPDAAASCFMLGGSVSLNLRTFWKRLPPGHNLISTVERHFPNKDPEDVTKAIISHELGHALDGYLSGKGIIGSTLTGRDTDFFSGVLRRRVLKSLKMTLKHVSHECSDYATKNPKEWFSECFAEAMVSAKPRPMAAEMMRQLKQILKEEGLSDD